MNIKLPSMRNKKIMWAAAIACALTGTIITSCTKSSSSGGTNYATQYLGTWTVTGNTCGSTGGTLTFSSSGTNSLSFPSIVGNTGCTKTITETGTASANGINFPKQTFTDGCDINYTFGVVGTLSGNTLTMVTTYPALGGNVTCTTTATK